MIVLEATAKFVKAKMKDWKESNINLIKESANTLKAMCDGCDRVPKRAVITFAPFLCDKIGDMKMTGMVKELMLQLTDFVTAKFVALQIIKYGSAAKAPKNIEVSVTVITTFF